MSSSVIKVKQLTASGLVTGKRALFKQLLVHHSGGGDTEIKFYDLTTGELQNQYTRNFFVSTSGELRTKYRT